MILQILNEINSDNSRNFKQAVLEKYKDNTLLQQVFKMALDPNIQFYIRKIPEHEFEVENQSLEWGLDSLFSLSNRVYTGHKGIEYLSNILSLVSNDDAEVIKRVIGKDLRCGVAASTVNKVWKNLIPEYPCMLASPFEERLLDKINFPAFAQVKMDGLRVCIEVVKGSVTLKTRQGKVIYGLTHIEEYFTNRTSFDYVLDGELIGYDSNGKILPRKISNGIANSAIRGKITPEDALKLQVVLWDFVLYDDFIAGKYENYYGSRFKCLQEFNLSYPAKIVKTREVNSVQEAFDFYDECYNTGEEGIILKDKNSIWENKRSKKQIKFKSEKECDLIVTGQVDGKGKNEGMVGSLICESSCGKLKVDVSGFTDHVRKGLTPDVYMNKIITVKFNEIIDSEDNPKLKSLFLPRAVQESKTNLFRIDKVTANSLEEIEKIKPVKRGDVE